MDQAVDAAHVDERHVGQIDDHPVGIAFLQRAFEGQLQMSSRKNIQFPAELDARGSPGMRNVDL
jgi:hypothetical protein